MQEAKTMWEQGSMAATIHTRAPKELVEHISETYLGTPGGLQYHHTTGLDKLKKIDNCYFAIMRRQGHLLGSIGYVLRDSQAAGTTYKSWLIRYFAVKAPMRAQEKAKRKIKKRPIKERSVSLLKNVTHIIHDNPERLIDLDVQEIPKAVIYGIVEKNNDRSRNFAEIGGYSKTGELESYMFSRLRQRKVAGVEQLDPSQKKKMQGLLREFYREHAFYFEDYLFLNDDYYVLKKDGEIVAGLQANKESWEIKTTGSPFVDKIVRFLTKNIRAIGKRFTYEEMKFLGIEGMYYKKGHEKDLYKLLEGVLAMRDHYLALMIMDTRSPEYAVFKKHKKLGPVNTVLGSFKGDIYCKFFSFPEKEKQEVAARPVYISIYDNT